MRLDRTLRVAAALLVLAAFLVVAPTASAQRAKDKNRVNFGGLLPNEEKFQQDVFDEEPEFWDELGNPLDGNATRAADPDVDVPDPLEPWNRFWFDFNEITILYVLEPVATVWKYVVPEPARVGIDNVFHNIKAPVRIINAFLQGQFFKSGVELSRFIGNTLFGLGGLFDVTKDLKPRRPISPGEEDFGQTLGVWGVGQGIYLVWPFFGPSSARDTVGIAGDMWMDPTWFLLSLDMARINPEWYISVLLNVGDRINYTSFRIGDYEKATEGMIDRYVGVRDAYLKLRAQKVRHWQTQPPSQSSQTPTNTE